MLREDGIPVVGKKQNKGWKHGRQARWLGKGTTDRVCSFLTLLAHRTTFPRSLSLECQPKKLKLFNVEIEVMEGMLLVATKHIRAWDTPFTFYTPIHLNI